MNHPPPRRIVLCADDYGMAPGVNRAIRDLVAQRRINATSAMAVAPSLTRAEAAALLEVARDKAAIGLHVTLTAPFRPLSDSYHPLRDGAFLPLGTMLVQSHLRRLDPDLLKIEIARQFEAFVAAFGRAPDFVDGHQHVHLLPQVSEALLRVMTQTSPNAWVRQCGRLPLPLDERLADRKALLLDWLSRRFRRLAGDFGIRTNPAFGGTYAFQPDADYGALFAKYLDGMPDGGLVMCHPGFVDAELKRLDPVTGPREREYAYLAGGEFPALLAARNLELG